MFVVERFRSDGSRQRRAHKRIPYAEVCCVKAGSRKFSAKGVNISQDGMCVSIVEFGNIKVDTPVTIHIQDERLINAVIRWTNRNFVGLEFEGRKPNIQELLDRYNRYRIGEFNDDPAHLRKTRRFKYTESCLVLTEKRTFQADGIDLSAGGISLKLQGLGAVEAGGDVQVVLPGDYPAVDGILRWEKERKVGVEFVEPIDDHPVLLALEIKNRDD